MGERVKKATGSDPEAVRAIAEASERARALVASLAALSGKVPRALLLSALRPALEPLARLLARRGAGGRAGARRDDDADPELSRLLIQELERHLVTLEVEPRDVTGAQRAIHALKGSAGLAGERELAATLERLDGASARATSAAYDEAAAVVRTAVQRLSRGRVGGRGALAGAARRPRRAAARSAGARAVRRGGHRPARAHRRARWRPATTRIEAARTLYRHVHTMKGAGSSVGDEPMSWFCHGLEERLRGRRLDGDARGPRCRRSPSWRVVLGALLDEPETALETLRARRRPSQMPLKALSNGPAPALRVGAPAALRLRRGDRDDPRARGGRRSPPRALRRHRARARAHRDAASTAGTAAALSMRRHRASLVEALRLIGPPRPVGRAGRRAAAHRGGSRPRSAPSATSSTRLVAAEHRRARAARRRHRREEAALGDAPDDGRAASSRG